MVHVQTEGHRTSYQEHTVYIEHIYEELRNYTVNVTVWNEVGSVTFSNIQIVEPILVEYINLTSSESSRPVPWTVDFTVTNMRQGLDFPI